MGLHIGFIRCDAKVNLSILHMERALFPVVERGCHDVTKCSRLVIDHSIMSADGNQVFRMKIAMGVRQFRAVGGAEKVTARLAAHLATSGHTVDVHAYRVDASEAATVHALGRVPRVPRAMRDWATGRGIARALRASGADITFGEQKTWGANIIRPGGGVEDAYWTARMAYAPFLRHPSARVLHPKRHFDVCAERNGYTDPALCRVIANSRMLREQLIARYPQLEEKVTVIHNGVDRVIDPSERDNGEMRKQLAACHGLDLSSVWLLFAGHEFKRKGLRHAIRALAHAHAAGVGAHLIVVGRDKTVPYQREADRCGVAEAIRFIGTATDVTRYYAACDALILPTYYDPFANVTIEALGAGLPVITTRQNGGSELVDDTCGWVVERPLAEDAMARAIGELSDSLVRAAKGGSALEVAARHLLINKMKEMEDVCLSVAEEKRAR